MRVYFFSPLADSPSGGFAAFERSLSRSCLFFRILLLDGNMAHQKQTVHSVQDLFTAALDLPPERRSAFLEAACLDAPATLKFLKDLLEEHERAGSFLAAPLFPASSGTDPTLSEAPGHGLAASTAPPRFRPFHVIAGRFQVVRFIARGGMGEVYEVRDQFLQGTARALKIIRPEIAGDPATCERFQQEVLLAQKIVHPNLCPIYDISRCDEPAPPFLFLTMKLLRGETLEARLRSPAGLGPSDALEICTQLVRGVAAIHSAGVIHRDLKPNNIMLESEAEKGKDTPRLCVYIMDFGLARLHEAEHTVAGTAIAGTPGYLAPELLRGHHPTVATDLFALGIVLHMTLTHERPLDDPKTLGLRPAPSLREGSAPAPWTSAVEGLLSLEPDQRIRAFEDLRATVDSRLPSRSRTLLTRRRFGMLATASTCALAAAGAWRREQIYDWLHPLPPKRFVAVVNWPPTKDPKIRAIMSGLLDSIASELSRAEAYDHNFFVTTPPPHQLAELHDRKDLIETSESLGTNLVLAASATDGDNRLRIALKVLDPSTPRTLRSKDLHAALSDVFSVPQQAVHIAAELLDVAYKPNQARSSTGTDSPQAYDAFQQAALLRNQDNDIGLDQAIAKYKQALDIDPRFAKAQAQLAWAYLRLYGLHSDPAALALARDDSEAAVRLDPELPEAHVALAWAMQQAGDFAGAEQQYASALSLDPTDAHTLNYQARLYAEMGQYPEAEATFARAIMLRPNYWLPRMEYGVLLDQEGKYDEALSEVRKASLAYPKSAVALSNVGAVCLDLGKVDDAVQALQASYKLQPTADAAGLLAMAARLRGHPADAITYAQTAVKLNPLPENWLELGDDFSAAGKSAAALGAYLRAAQAAEELVSTQKRNGPGWMLLALCRAKAGDSSGAPELIARAEKFNAKDMPSQLIKVRTLALLGNKDEAFDVMAQCLRHGATPFQFQTLPDLGSLRADPRFSGLVASARSGAAT